MQTTSTYHYTYITSNETNSYSTSTRYDLSATTACTHYCSTPPQSRPSSYAPPIPPTITPNFTLVEIKPASESEHEHLLRTSLSYASLYRRLQDERSRKDAVSHRLQSLASRTGGREWWACKAVHEELRESVRSLEGKVGEWRRELVRVRGKA
ncbi:hypothetical protein LTR08_007192 [Meristemomyces frigidus]|nr:hypothetical protein LTR08_007192 [Meristemomyces frigidus]